MILLPHLDFLSLHQSPHRTFYPQLKGWCGEDILMGQQPCKCIEHEVARSYGRVNTLP